MNSFTARLLNRLSIYLDVENLEYESQLFVALANYSLRYVFLWTCDKCPHIVSKVRGFYFHQKQQ